MSIIKAHILIFCLSAPFLIYQDQQQAATNIVDRNLSAAAPVSLQTPTAHPDVDESPSLGEPAVHSVQSSSSSQHATQRTKSRRKHRRQQPSSINAKQFGKTKKNLIDELNEIKELKMSSSASASEESQKNEETPKTILNSPRSLTYGALTDSKNVRRAQRAHKQQTVNLQDGKQPFTVPPPNTEFNIKSNNHDEHFKQEIIKQIDAKHGFEEQITTTKQFKKIRKYLQDQIDKNVSQTIAKKFEKKWFACVRIPFNKFCCRANTERNYKQITKSIEKAKIRKIINENK